jgi:hypothetical protein
MPHRALGQSMKLGELPADVDLLREQIGELCDDLPGRLDRHKTVVALETDFHESGALFPGGYGGYQAYLEARKSYIAGNFVAAILLAQACAENLLAGHLIIEEVARHAHGQEPFAEKGIPRRPSFDWVLTKCRETGLLNADSEASFRRLQALRNPLSHFRSLEDETNLSNRAGGDATHPLSLCEEDARFAFATIARVVPRLMVAIGRRDWSVGASSPCSL